jgi:hypothetical protein
MDSINISTPALLFSGISLFILAFTNRFHTVAQLIRQFIASYQEEPDQSKLRQIKNFKIRLTLIKYTQVFAVISFLCCSINMLFILLDVLLVSEILFLGSLLLIVMSLICALIEILKSITALKIELEKIDIKK